MIPMPEESVAERKWQSDSSYEGPIRGGGDEEREERGMSGKEEHTKKQKQKF